VTPDPLSRLRDGLARDAEIARAAAEQSPEWTNGYEAGGVFEGGSSAVLGEHTFAQVARHGPARVLRQVEKLQELVDEARFVLGKNDPGLTDAGTLAESVIDTLASIYTEDTETGDKS
jgi:hypothetical protein